MDNVINFDSDKLMKSASEMVGEMLLLFNNGMSKSANEFTHFSETFILPFIVSTLFASTVYKMIKDTAVHVTGNNEAFSADNILQLGERLIQITAGHLFDGVDPGTILQKVLDEIKQGISAAFESPVAPIAEGK